MINQTTIPLKNILSTLKYHNMRVAYLLVLVVTASAATLFSINPNFTISYQQTHEQLAHGYYDQKLNSQGINYLYIYANSLKSLIDQHRGAGFIEGYTTYQQIQAAYHNFNTLVFSNAVSIPKLQEYLSSQMDFIDSMATRFPRDNYWQMASAYLEQCRYAYRGFLQRINEEDRLDMYIGFSQYYYLTNIGDFRELLTSFGASVQTTANKSGTAFIKKIEDELYVAHSSQNFYPQMLRVMKSFNFPTRDPTVGSETLTFTSRPGDFSSKDSFYILSSGLKIVETSFLNYNKDNYQQLNPKSVPSWLRVNIASNLAKNGQEWIDYFSKYNSGTHSGQWVIIDQANIHSDNGLVVFLEQAFSMVRVTDMTQNILKQGYVGSFNVPFDQSIYDKLQYQNYQFDYQSDPSASILRKINSVVNNQEDIKIQMLLNNQTHPGYGIAPRKDLESDPVPFGLIDCKVSSSKTEENNYFWVRSGPTINNKKFTPFTWKTFPAVSHEGMPQIYNFQWQKVVIDYEKSLQATKSKNLETE